MKLELIERDREGHEVRVVSRDLQPSQEWPLKGASTL